MATPTTVNLPAITPGTPICSLWGHPVCRTSHSNILCSLVSSLGCFSTRCTPWTTHGDTPQVRRAWHRP